ncbi:MAG: hypothetical protein A2Z11_04855 [Candidatus Woykebacteria bacterium RBG_16_43_9]|uniref:Uncharacterized protein n=1 Tax=Candidatus Woykebacteria bacterium RBG_16_43_9 TaxID=1802596 RepID=A0A1G1WB96_9BACT|nr:MAG: hypothetical protein A2Z11_04855 [Candidatus Woykebacteria bacterium RBG_16_43_9]
MNIAKTPLIVPAMKSKPETKTRKMATELPTGINIIVRARLNTKKNRKAKVIKPTDHLPKLVLGTVLPPIKATLMLG